MSEADPITTIPAESVKPKGTVWTVTLEVVQPEDASVEHVIAWLKYGLHASWELQHGPLSDHELVARAFRAEVQS